MPSVEGWGVEGGVEGRKVASPALRRDMTDPPSSGE